MAAQIYRIRAPLSTHTRPATCEEVACEHQRDGWRSMIDERSLLGARQAHYIRRGSGRSFVESRDPTGLTVFSFSAGQRCFTAHRVSLDREPLYFVDRRRFDRGDQWVDHQSHHLDRIRTMRERG